MPKETYEVIVEQPRTLAAAAKKKFIKRADSLGMKLLSQPVAVWQRNLFSKKPDAIVGASVQV
jgi:hypothetical protein